jgi:hypothetical protein
MTTSTDTDRAALEQLIDRIGHAGVLKALADAKGETERLAKRVADLETRIVGLEAMLTDGQAEIDELKAEAVALRRTY